MKGFLKGLFIVFFSAALLFSSAYLYLDYSLGSAFEADKKNDTTPYKILPQNSGIVFILPDSSAVVAYLDFENNCINLVDVAQYDPEQKVYNGYTAQYNLQVSYELIEGLVDRIGGINVDIGDTAVRLTGHQAATFVKQNDTSEIKRRLIYEIFNQISKNNFSKSDFLYIIENSKNNLSLVECITWIDYIRDMSKNINFVN